MEGEDVSSSVTRKQLTRIRKPTRGPAVHKLPLLIVENKRAQLD